MRKFLKDDAPDCIKRTRLQAQTPTGLYMLNDVALNAAAYEKDEVWMDKDQLRGTCSLIRRDVKGVRVHANPRKKLYDHPRHAGSKRLTVMMAQEEKCFFQDDEAERKPARKQEAWRGVTVFYQDLPTADAKGT